MGNIINNPNNQNPTEEKPISTSLERPERGFFGQHRQYHEDEREYLITKSGVKIDNTDPYYYILLQIYHYKNYLKFYAVSSLLVGLILIIIGMVFVAIANISFIVAIIVGAVFLINSFRYNHIKYKFIRSLRLYSSTAPKFKQEKTPLPKFLSQVYRSLRKRLITTNIACGIIYLLSLSYIIVYLILDKHNIPSSFFVSRFYVISVIIFVATILYHTTNLYIIYKRKTEIEIIFNKGDQIPIWNMKHYLKRKMQKKAEEQNLKMDVVQKTSPVYVEDED
ncbi:MAG: hypothetical protein ACRAS9_02500 [Mycoplasma sp.]